MELRAVTGDITKLQVDAIVNIANPEPILGYDCDTGIHKKAGPEILQAKKVGSIGVGQVVKNER